MINTSPLSSELKKTIRSKYLSEGFTSLSDHEILELLLSFSAGRNFSDTADKLYEAFGSANAVSDADENYLKKGFSLDEKSITLLKLLPQLSRLYFMNTDSTDKLFSSSLAIRYFEKFFIGYVTEQFAVVCIDKSFNITASSVVSAGFHNSVNISLRDIADFTLKNNSDRIIISHNHISGNPLPSVSDINNTDIICRRLENIGIHLIDHIIISKSGSFSMREMSTLLPFRNSETFGYSFRK